MDQIAQVSNDKYRLTIYPDYDCSSPREWDNLGTIVYSHRNYILGDEKAENINCYEGWDEWFQHELGDDVIALPLYLYDHSGLTMRTRPFSCPWDSGQVGYIYITREDARNEFGVKRISAKLEQRIIDCLESEIKVYDHWGTGDVYGFVLESIEHCAECDCTEYKHLDSCWGFIGPDFIDELYSQIGSEYHSLIDQLKEEAA